MHKSQSSLLLLATIVVTLFVGIGSPRAADPESIVKALKTVAGNPPKMRATFARGQCVRGTYAPSADAAKVTSSISFTRPWPILGRFSVGGGNPNVPDTTKTVLRGFALKILSEGNETHLLVENAPIHFAKTLDQMLEFLKVRAPGPDGKPDQDSIRAFAASNPETTRQAAFVSGKPLPASYAGIIYWGVHTFTGVNAGGNLVPFKFKLVPQAGELFVSEDEAKNQKGNFLIPDLTERIAKGPVKFDIIALLARSDDQTTDVTLRWPNEDDRPAVVLGTVAITSIEPNETCEASIFDPAQLANGLRPPEDEMFKARQPAYGISFGLRAE